ncbi:facilitated trehalose transporter Tret1-like isoform X2 [Ischnura elegans]|nr:facilitated trehalose transporter Tret1-like isoform X2 [Ischnura elegans]XP_046383725.1 facilitated trehalose transporter Tret1-like isoform X2 [Ischnura elegans]
MSATVIGVSSQTLVSTTSTARKLPQYVAALTATLGAFALGTALAWSSPALPKLMKGGEAKFKIEQYQESWISSLLTLGAAAIALPIGYCMDWIGRKLTMIILAVPFVMGWALIVWATNVDMLYAGRFFCGMSGGAFAVVAPVYIGETAQKDIRGTLGTYFQLMICGGILFAYIVGSYLSVFWFSIICGIIPIIFAAGILAIPESPAFLLAKGKVDEARKALTWLRGKEYALEAELEEMKLTADNAAESQKNVNIFAALRTRASINALIISLGLMVFQQLSGINAVIFNTTDIFEAAQVEDSSVSTIVVGAVQLVATFISTLVVDRFGRRVLLILSDAVMSLCSVALGVYFYLQSTHADVSNLTWLPLTSMCIFIIVFSLGYGPVPWFIVGELYPAEVKKIASPISSITNWLLAFVVTKFFNDFSGKHIAFWSFAVISFIGVLFVFFVVIETKGKSLEEIQRELGSRWKSRKNKVDVEGRE